MAAFERFGFKTLGDFQRKIDELGVNIPVTEAVDVLGTPAQFGRITVPNRMVVQPMEGCDADCDGRPSDLTLRKYERFAAGGAGMHWLEACAVVPEGRANPRQIMLTEETKDTFKEMVDRMHAAAQSTMGANFRPALVLQLTHSGRYSKPVGPPAPLIAHHSIIDSRSNVTNDTPLLTDEYLDSLADAYVASAKLAREVGFDAVDIKACHRYLVSELLASFTRENSRYGGSFENRVRLLVDTARRVAAAVPELEVSSRLNIYDALEYPYGWGVSKDDYLKPDFTEVQQLIKILMEIGYHGLDTTIGNPYYNPHFGRPFDFPIKGMYTPEEHPLQTLERFIEIISGVQHAFPDLNVIGSGYTWTRQFFPNVAAAVINSGGATMIGLGRGALAYPDFARDILNNGGMEPKKTCVTCSACTQIMRDGGRSGCVVRDSAVYGPIYRDGRKLSTDLSRELASKCRVCATPTCQDMCPAGVDVPGFIRNIADGNDRAAYDILRKCNALPEICSHVCPAEVQCEAGCIENILGFAPIPIRQLQKYVSLVARKNGWTRLTLPAPNGKSAAIIGGGPAGIACAVRLLEQGFKVTIIDAAATPGGTVEATIPAERMPKDVLRDEIASLFDMTDPERLEWKGNTPLTADYNLDSVLAEGYDSVFIGLGLPRSQQLDTPHPEHGVLDALDFLREVKQGQLKAPKRVAVIGGGNSAMDAAVSAVNAGAEDVYILYRRSFNELPAWPDERNHALNNGVNFLILAQPAAYITDDRGNLMGVQILRTQLGAPDASGRRAPVAIPGSEFLLEVDLVVEAIGQLPPAKLDLLLPGVKLNKWGYIVTDEGTTRTSLPNVYAGGDIVNGGATAVAAISAGMQAAEEMGRG